MPGPLSNHLASKHQNMQTCTRTSNTFRATLWHLHVATFFVVTRVFFYHCPWRVLVFLRPLFRHQNMKQIRSCDGIPIWAFGAIQKRSEKTRQWQVLSSVFLVLVGHRNIRKLRSACFSVHFVYSRTLAMQGFDRILRTMPHSLTACAVATVFPLSLLQSRVFSEKANVLNLHRHHILLLSIDGSLLSFDFLLLLLNHLLLSIDDSLLSFDFFLLVLNQQQKFIAWSDRPVNAERHVGFNYKMQELDTKP